MNIFLTNILLIGLSTGWFSAKQSFNGNEKLNTGEVLNVSDDLYDLQFKIETTSDNNHNLIIGVKLHNGSHFVSPHAKQGFKGKFFMDLGSYTDLEFNGEIIETPKSVEEFDAYPFVNRSVNWVRVNTTYKQPLQVKSTKDFEVFGRIRFTIEPRCTLEEIPFSISYNSGKLKIKEAKC